MAAGGRRGSVLARRSPNSDKSPDTKLDLTANLPALPGVRPTCGTATCRSGRRRTSLRVPVSARHLRDRSPPLGVPGWATSGCRAVLSFHGRLLGPAAGSRVLGAGGPSSRAVGRGVRAVPRVLTTLVDLVGNLPMMLAPRALLPIPGAVGTSGRSVRALAAQAGLAVALMGAVNAIARLSVACRR